MSRFQFLLARSTRLGRYNARALLDIPLLQTALPSAKSPGCAAPPAETPARTSPPAVTVVRVLVPAPQATPIAVKPVEIIFSKCEERLRIGADFLFDFDRVEFRPEAASALDQFASRILAAKKTVLIEKASRR